MNYKKNLLQKLTIYSILGTLLSCEIFTFSLGEDLVRDQNTLLENTSILAIADVAGDASSRNKETAIAIFEELANKTDEEIVDLNIGQKENILDLALDATLPIGVVATLANSVSLSLDHA